MIQVTGLFRTKQNGRYFENPELHLVPQLQFYGKTLLEVHIFTEGLHTGGYLIEDIGIDIFEGATGNAYNYIIKELEKVVIDEAQSYNPDCVFEVVPVIKPE